jgi:sporulation protein YlmC with PRC-barrel domain
MRTFRKEDVVGKTVIETTGTVKGKVADVMFDLAGTVTFMVQGTDGTVTQVPVARVTGISEHVIVKSDQAFGGSGSGSGTSCKFCGAPKAPGAMWCPSCGKSQV